jgi:hypothetical protein
LITANLYDEILLKPYRDLHAKELYIVSGYATPAMVYRHFEEACEIKIHLLIGMAKNGGVGIRKHNAFKQMVENDFAGQFTCGYINLPIPVHSKTYGWFNGSVPIAGFIGSANYSQNAFSARQGEAMNENSPVEIYDYYQEMLHSSINCLNPAVTEIFTLKDETNEQFKQISPSFATTARILQSTPLENLKEGIDFVRLSLITDKKGPLRVPERSGLNWGQRPEEGREPNQAYIPIPVSIQRSGFFPERFIPFIIYTDDNKYLDCVRAQDNGKGLHTYRNNSFLGEYFRNRIHVPLGQKVVLEDLYRYGRTDVVIYKIDDENYYMDFSV